MENKIKTYYNLFINKKIFDKGFKNDFKRNDKFNE